MICGELFTVDVFNRCRASSDGGCTFHAIGAHKGVGIFYLVSNCNLLLVSGNKKAFWMSPYIDRNGEERQLTNRALPLRLDPRRVTRIQQLFASHGVPQEVTTLRQVTDRVILDESF